MITNTRWARVLPLSLTIATLLSAVSVFAQTPTFTRYDYPGFGNTHIVADFNGDGRPDLAVTGLPFVTIRLNNGNGTFGDAVDYPVFQTPNSAQGLVAGDFNGDGRMDLVVTLNDPVTSLSLLTGNGDGTFNPPVDFPNTTGFDSPAVAAVDLNNDGKLDIVIAHDIACFTVCVGTTLMSVMIGNGDGTFQPTRQIDVGRGMTSIAVGDFNRDGHKDLAIAGMQGQVYRLYGVGDGTFVQQPTLTVVVDTFFIPATDIAVADFNGDSIEDLVVAVPHNGSRTAILIGNGDGTFRTPLIITDPGLNLPHRQAVADFNGDGFQDLALSLADGLTGLMYILNGNGDGTFQPPVLYLPPPPTSSGGAQIVVADLNGDNKPDITLNRSGAFGGGLVLLNSTGAAPPPRPAAPTLLTPASNATVAQPVTFDWNNVANAVSYQIQIDNSSTISAPFTASQIVNGSQVTIGGLPAQQLWWRVRARNAAGVFGPFSATRRFTAQAAPTALSAIAIDPTIVVVVGGTTAMGTATLTAAAPTGGAVVTLSDNSTAASVPASVTIPAGATSTTFTVSTVSVTTSTLVTITGTFGGATRSATLTVIPPPPPVGPASVSVPQTVQGGAGATGTVWLSVGAPAGGLVVSLSSSNTAAATVPATMIVHGGLSSGTFPISTLAAETNRTTIITASANSISRTATMTVIGSAAPPPPTPTGLSLLPSTVAGGAGSTGTVTLSSAALAGGLVVFLSSSDTAVATVPATMTVPGGLSSATFPVSTFAPATTRTTTITASANGISRTATLTVNGSAAPPPAPTPSGLSLSPATVQGGNSSTGTVTLSAAAPTGGAVVTLASNNSAATVPASVTVAQGATSATFVVTTSTVAASTPVTLTASAGGVTRTAVLTVTPPGTNVTLTVTATGRSGERITSSPAGINVAVGSTGSGSFAANSSITLSVTNGRDAIWSGACSSGGDKRRTCTFTITGNTAVSGNVQ